MKTEEKGGKTSFEQAGQARRGLLEEAKITKEAKIIVPSWLTAIITRFPRKVLEESGILIIPKEGDIEIVVSTERHLLLKEILQWTSGDGRSQNDVLAKLYPALIKIGQASVISEVDLAHVFEPHRELVRGTAGFFPFLESLADFIEAGGKLTGGDQVNLQETAYYILSRLESAGHSKVSNWKSSGLIPENMFKTPDE